MRQREFSDAQQIQVIACPNLEIDSLEGIRALNNLRYLDLAGNLLVHLDELRQLNRLSSVNAPHNDLRDISGILNIASLTSAVLTGNNAIPCAQLDTLAQRLGQSLLRPDQCIE
jgi:Leucine-rich repeat (LRR) protein